MIPSILVTFMLLASVLSQSTSAATAAGPKWITAAGATSKTACSLLLHGSSNQSGLIAAQLSCTGGTVTARAHKVLKRLWGSNLPQQGVTWTEGDECNFPSCLLTICGQSDAVFIKPEITSVAMDPKGDVVMVLCIVSSRVTMRQCNFSSCPSNLLAVLGNQTSVLLDKCSISNNNVTSGVWAYNGSIVVRSSTFTHNMADATRNSILAAVGNSRMAVIDSTFQGNTAARCGAALYVDDTAQVTIRGSLFQANNATYGGAICTAGQGSVNIQPGTSPTVFVNNTVTAVGADIHAVSKAAVLIFGALLAGGRARYGGSLGLEGNSTMYLTNTTIYGARALVGGGCINLYDSTTLRVTQSHLADCQANEEGGGIRLKEDSRLELVNSTISSSVAGDNMTFPGWGGAIAAADASHVVLQGATLTNNTALSGVGGLHLKDSATLVVLGPVKTRIINNRAEMVCGGLRLVSANFAPAELTNFLLVHNNSAPYSANISVAGTSITVVDYSGADSVVSSDSKEVVLVLTLNVSGPYGWPSDDLVHYNFKTDTGESRGSYSASDSTAKGGLRKLPVRFKHPPGRYRLTIYTPWGGADTSVNITIIPCPKGYVTGGRDDTCNPCPQGLYSFTATDATCSLCPANAECPGLATVWPAPGFWKSAPQSVQVHRCLNADACLGAKSLMGTSGNQTRRPLGTTPDTDYKSAQCSELYHGNLCGLCKRGFGKVRSFHCRKCMSTGAIVALYLLAAVAMTGLVKLLVYFQTAADASPRTNLLQPIPAELLRALVIHTQWLYIIGNLDVPLPQSLLYPIQVIGGIWSSTSGSSLGLECILSSTSMLPVAVQKVLICLFTPLGILCAVLVIEAVVHCLRPRKSGSMGHDFASVVMCIVFMFLPTWVNTALSLFTCVPLDTATEPPFQAEAVGSWWSEDMSQLCYSRSGYHRVWALGLGIPLALLFCVALPAGVFVFMWVSRKQGKLQDMQFQKHYGFVYRLWRDEWVWWESVVLLQTCVLVMISTFGFALGPFYQTIVSAAVLAWTAIALLAVRPYKCPAAGRVAMISVCVLFFTAYACLTFLPYYNAGPGAVYSNIMGAVIIIANVTFLLGTAWLLVRSVDWCAVKTWFSCCCSLGRRFADDGVRRRRGAQPGRVAGALSRSAAPVADAPVALPSDYAKRASDRLV